MKINDILTLKILRLGDNGEGIAEAEKLVIFVPFALVSEVVKVKIIHIKKRYAFGKLIKVLEKSPDRVEPKCEYFGVCGGCDIQHMNYTNQLLLKQNILEDCLRKFSGEILKAQKTVKSDLEYNYRNKIQLPIGFKNNKVVVGFYKKGSHEIVPIKSCPLHGDWADKLINLTLNWANKFRITAYNEKSHKGLLRHIVARNVDNHMNVTLVINGDDVPKIEEFSKVLGNNFESFSLFVCINKKKTNVILTNVVKPIIQPKNLINVNEIKCEISPLSFFQVNDNVRQKLYDAVVNSVGKNDIIIDAYSGIGFMTNYLAKNCNQVYGIEIVKEAVENANILAKNNGNNDKICNICGDTALILPQLVTFLKENKNKDFINNHFNKNEEMHICECDKTSNNKEHICKCGGNCSCNKNADLTKQQLNISNSIDKIAIVLDLPRKGCVTSEQYVTENISDKKDLAKYKNSNPNDKIAIVLDPPRKGCDLSVIQSVIESKADTIVYVSCNPTTLARDLKYLLPYYTPTKITPFDMFPNTSHLETLCWLSKKS